MLSSMDGTPLALGAIGAVMLARKLHGSRSEDPAHMADVEAVKDAIDTVNWRWWNRGASYLDEAVVSPLDDEAAREWATRAKVVVFREYGYPDIHTTFWTEVDEELDRMGAGLYHELINQAVVAYYPTSVKDDNSWWGGRS